MDIFQAEKLSEALLRIYPVTIVMTRYGGTYEGGLNNFFMCIPGNLEDFPEAATGDDIECMTWWRDNLNVAGVGSTPTDALKDYYHKTFAQELEI